MNQFKESLIFEESLGYLNSADCSQNSDHLNGNHKRADVNTRTVADYIMSSSSSSSSEEEDILEVRLS